MLWWRHTPRWNARIPIVIPLAISTMPCASVLPSGHDKMKTTDMHKPCSLTYFALGSIKHPYSEHPNESWNFDISGLTFNSLQTCEAQEASRSIAIKLIVALHDKILARCENMFVRR
jgi:hypothetical protein